MKTTQNPEDHRGVPPQERPGAQHCKACGEWFGPAYAACPTCGSSEIESAAGYESPREGVFVRTEPTSKTTFQWKSDIVHCGGGARHDKPRTLGFIRVTPEGLSIEPDDDYYGGDLTREEALELAAAIQAAYDPKS